MFSGLSTFSFLVLEVENTVWPSFSVLAEQIVITLAPDLRLWDRQDFTMRLYKAHLSTPLMRRLAQNLILI